MGKDPQVPRKGRRKLDLTMPQDEESGISSIETFPSEIVEAHHDVESYEINTSTLRWECTTTGSMGLEVWVIFDGPDDLVNPLHWPMHRNWP
jgi:hypothetical protein